MKKLKVFLISITLFFIGYLREFIFLNLNHHIKTIEYNQKIEKYPWPIDFFTELDLNSAQTYKWFFTIFFTLVFLGLTLLIIQLFFRNSSYLKFVLIFFGIFFLASFIIYSGGLLLGEKEMGYIVSRRIMGYVQSPVILMLLFPILYLYERIDLRVSENNT